MQPLEHQDALMTQGCCKSRLFFGKVLSRRALPDQKINLSDLGDIPLFTIGDSAFPRFSWLIKCYNENTRDPHQRYFNKMLYSARVVSENTYGMLKGRSCFLHKKIEAQIFATSSLLALHYITFA